MTSRKRRLGLLRPALMAMLDELGAEEISAEDADYFDRAARNWVHDAPMKNLAARMGLSRDETPIVKAARQLGIEEKSEAVKTDEPTEAERLANIKARIARGPGHLEPVTNANDEKNTDLTARQEISAEMVRDLLREQLHREPTAKEIAAGLKDYQTAEGKPDAEKKSRTVKE